MFKYIYFLSVVILAGCSFQTKIPVDTLFYPGNINVDNSNKDSTQLIVLLRGYGNDINYFDKNGWREKLQQRYPAYSIIVPDLHYGYYKEGIFFKRLYDDVIVPAKQSGIKSIWLVGISMGGLGAILTSEYAMDDIKRLFLIAPYLGNGTIKRQIEKIDRLSKLDGQQDNQSKWQLKLWSHLNERTKAEKTTIPIYIGYGEQDNMPGLKYLATALPKQQIISVPGGHTDDVFTSVFELMLQRGFFE